MLMLAIVALAGLTTAAHAGTLTPIYDPAPANSVTLLYDPATGNLSYSGNGTLISTIELKSAGQWFIPANLRPEIQLGPFDVATPAKMFRLITAGTEGEDFGPILPSGLSFDAVLADIAIDGSIKPAGKLHDAPGGGPYLLGIPEPSGLVLACCGLMCLLTRGGRSLIATDHLP
jgi:hypothetical protein